MQSKKRIVQKVEKVTNQAKLTHFLENLENTDQPGQRQGTTFRFSVEKSTNSKNSIYSIKRLKKVIVQNKGIQNRLE